MVDKISHIEADDTMINVIKKRSEYLLPNDGGRIISYRPYDSLQIIFFDVHSSEIPNLWQLGFRKVVDCRFLRTFICKQGGCDFVINNEKSTLSAGNVMMDYGIGDDGSFTFTTDEFIGVDITFQPDPLVHESAMFRMLRFIIEGMMLPEEDIFDSNGYLFPYSKSTEQTLDKLLAAGLNSESIMILTHTVEIGHNLGTDLKNHSVAKIEKENEKHRIIADDIYQCLTEDIGTKYTASMFAEKYGVSDTSVKKYFKNIYGYGFKEYQTKVRMEWAAERLVATDMSVGYISDRVGYSKQTKFTKAFKKYFGVTPSEYRHNNK